MPTELEELEVDRVDAVDSPATGAKFLILKAEEPDELRQNAQQLAEAANAVLSSLSQDKAVSYSPDAVSKLNALAKMLDVETEFTPKKPEKNDADSDTKGEKNNLQKKDQSKEKPKVDPQKGEPEQQQKDQPDLHETISKSIMAGFEKLTAKIESLAKEPEEVEQQQQKTAPVSKQAKLKGDDSSNDGEVSFENIFFPEKFGR